MMFDDACLLIKIIVFRGGQNFERVKLNPQFVKFCHEMQGLSLDIANNGSLWSVYNILSLWIELNET